MDYDYNQEDSGVVPVKQNNGVGIASLVCGIVSLMCCNPLYLVSAAAIIMGIVSLCMGNNSKGYAIAGMICGGCAVLFGIILDIILLPVTFGSSFFF